MGIIWFNIEEAYYFLMENGEVFTLRPYKKIEGRVMILSKLEGKPYFKGMGELIFCREIDMSDIISKAHLHNYVYKSGFNSIEEWLAKAKPIQKYYLYYLKLGEKNGKIHKRPKNS